MRRATLAAVGLVLAAVSAGGGAGRAAETARRPAHADALYGVSCTSARRCVAVGDRTAGKAGNYRPLAELWNGTRWRVVPMPGPATLVRTHLSQVSCESPRSCVAVGYHYGSRGIADLAERWNGSRWRIIESRSPLGSGGLLNDVNCRNPFGCVAVGEYATGSGAVLALAELWTKGRWHVLRLPSQAGTEDTALYAISCSYSYCMAVGSQVDAAGRQRTLAYSWTGSAWTSRSPRNSGQPDTVLYGVSCAASARCMAVGSASARRLQLPFTELWANGRWTPVPGGREAGGALRAVSCPGVARCLAVGSAAGRPLITAWSGLRWRVMRAARARGRSSGVLYHLSCHTQSIRCIAVGSWLRPATKTASATLAEEWNGHSWAVMATGNP